MQSIFYFVWFVYSFIYFINFHNVIICNNINVLLFYVLLNLTDDIFAYSLAAGDFGIL